MRSRSLLDGEELSRAEIIRIFEQAKAFKEVIGRPIRKVPALRGKSILLFFAEPSTRTRVSFETAAKILSADVTTITQGSSSVQKGESWQDTFLTLAQLPFDLAVVRHRYEGMPAQVARWFGKSVISAGDGCHAHPTQALLDAYTLWERLGKLDGLRITFLGDITHSRVARSGIALFHKLGASVAVCAPPYFLPPLFASIFPFATVFSQIAEALHQTDVLIALRVQRERQAVFYSEREYEQLYSLTIERLRGAKEGMLIMHPGPVGRGFELKKEVMESPQTLILDQVRNGVAIRMALLYVMLAGVPKERQQNEAIAEVRS